MLSKFCAVVLAIVATAALWSLQPTTAWAGAAEGTQVFKANCAACHALGTNRIIVGKNLQKNALEKYDMYSQEAIVYQVTNGKNAMPPFGNRLTTEEIESVADYVLEQADLGWPA